MKFVRALLLTLGFLFAGMILYRSPLASRRTRAALYDELVSNLRQVDVFSAKGGSDQLESDQDQSGEPDPSLDEVEGLLQSTLHQINSLSLRSLKRRYASLRRFAARESSPGRASEARRAESLAQLLLDMIQMREKYQPPDRQGGFDPLYSWPDAEGRSSMEGD